MKEQPGAQTIQPLHRGMMALVGAHLAAGIVLGFLVRRYEAASSSPYLLLALFIGLLFCQMGLHGVWLGLGRNSLWIRGIGCLVGLVYLWMWTCFGVGLFLWEYAVLVVTPTVAVAAILLVVRGIGWALTRDSVVTHSRSALQFGIRHVMLFTLAVAVTLAIGRWAGFRRFRLEPGFGWIIVQFTVAIVLVTLVSIWATLGRTHWLPRGAVAITNGLAVGWGLDQMVRDPPRWIYMAAIATTTVLLSASLLVVRACGYRLARACRTAVAAQQPPSR